MLGSLGLLANLKWLAAFVAVAGIGLVSYHGLIPGDEYFLTVPLDSASGLYPGSDVLIAGSKAGSVQEIKLGRGDTAMVRISINPDHAPVKQDATAAMRPKSLLGEKFIDLDPGKSTETLQNNTTLDRSKVKRAVELEEVVNTLDKPTREKLKTLVIELGGGLAGRGVGLNKTFDYGTRDMEDLTAVADTLRNRDAELETVIQALDDVLAELARSDRREELAGLIQNSDRLLHQLNTQSEELKRALVNADAALSRTDRSLTGTEQNLNNIFRQSPVLVNRVDLLLGDLGSGFDTYVGPNCTDQAGKPQRCMDEHIKGIKEGTRVFGGLDQSGYATRVNINFGCDSVSDSNVAQACNAAQPGSGTRQPTGQQSAAQQDLLAAVNGILFGPAPSGVRAP